MVDGNAGLDRYEIGPMIAPGGTSAVFTGFKRHHPLHKRWRVAIKFVWDLGLAREEAENLISLDAIKGVVNLLDYFEVPLAEVEPHLKGPDPGLEATYSASILKESFQNNRGMVGVLVLQFLAGAPLVKSTVPAEGDDEADRENFFLIQDIETKGWLKQELSWDLDLRERFHILLQVASYLAEIHEKGVVHGDLKPQNILYSRETRRVTILDFGGATIITRGTPGWQAPEHLMLALGDIQTAPPGLDVFVLGLFLNRFLQPFHLKGIKALTQRCLGPLEQRPDAHEVETELNALERRLFRGKLERYSVRVLAFLLVLSTAWGGYLYLNRGGPSLRDRFGKDDGLSLVNKVTKMDVGETSHPKKLRDELDGIYFDRESWPALRANVSRAKALYFQKVFPETVSRTVHPEDIRLVWSGPIACFVKTGSWLEIGDFFKPGLFLKEITHRFNAESLPEFTLHLESFDGSQERMEITHFSYPGEDMAPGLLFFHETPLEELIHVTETMLSGNARFVEAHQTPARGVLYFDTGEALLEQLRACYVHDKDETGLTNYYRPRQKEYYFGKFSSIRISEARELRQMVTLIAQERRLTVVDDGQLLQGLQTLRAVQSEMIEWQVILNMLLEQHGLHAELSGNRIYISK